MKKIKALLRNKIHGEIAAIVLCVALAAVVLIISLSLQPEKRSADGAGAVAIASNRAVTTTVATLDTVNLTDAGSLSLWVEYAKGTESGALVKVYFLPEYGGTAYQELNWSASSGTRTATANTYSMTTTGNYYLSYDVSAIPYFYVTVASQGATATGAVTISYVTAQ